AQPCTTAAGSRAWLGAPTPSLPPPDNTTNVLCPFLFSESDTYAGGAGKRRAFRRLLFDRPVVAPGRNKATHMGGATRFLPVALLVSEDGRSRSNALGVGKFDYHSKARWLLRPRGAHNVRSSICCQSHGKTRLSA